MTLIPFIVIIIEYVLYATFNIGIQKGIAWQYFFILWAALLICLGVCVWSLINAIRNIRYKNTRVSAIFATVMSASGITSAITLFVVSIINVLAIANGDGSYIFIA